MQKKSFFERLTGVVKLDENGEENHLTESHEGTRTDDDIETEGELAIDMYQTPTQIIIKTMVSGTKPEDLDISITREMVTIKGKREEIEDAVENDFFHRELYWGVFSRTVILPEEIDVEEADATNKNGLLVLILPKIDKHKQAKVKVKAM